MPKIFSDAAALKDATTQQPYQHFYTKLLEDDKCATRLLKLIEADFFGNAKHLNNIWSNIEALIKDQYPEPPQQPLARIQPTKLLAILDHADYVNALCSSCYKEAWYSWIAQLKDRSKTAIRRLGEGLEILAQEQDEKADTVVLLVEEKKIIRCLAPDLLTSLEHNSNWDNQEIDAVIVRHADRYLQYAPDLLKQSSDRSDDSKWTDDIQKNLCLAFRKPSTEVEQNAVLTDLALAEYSRIARKHYDAVFEASKNADRASEASGRVWLLLGTLPGTSAITVKQANELACSVEESRSEELTLLEHRINLFCDPKSLVTTEVASQAVVSHSSVDKRGTASSVSCEAQSCLKKFGCFAVAEAAAAVTGYVSLADAKALTGLAEALNWSVATVGSVVLALIVACVFALYCAYASSHASKQHSVVIQSLS